MKKLVLFRKSLCPVIIGVIIFIAGLMHFQAGYGQNWPVNFDGASALNPGQMGISPFFSGSYALYQGKSSTFGYLPGIKIGFGIANNFDLKLSYSRGIYAFHPQGKWTDSGHNDITISPKASFLKGILAFKIPFSFILYNDANTKTVKLQYIISPRFIVSLHYEQFIEFNISPFYEFYIPGGSNDPTSYVGGNLGFAFSSNLERWSVQPEAFVSYPIPKKNGGSSLVIYGWGLAASLNFDAFVKKRSLHRIHPVF